MTNTTESPAKSGHTDMQFGRKDLLAVLLLTLVVTIHASGQGEPADTSSVPMERSWYNAAFESTYHSAVMYDGYARPESSGYNPGLIRASASGKEEEERFLTAAQHGASVILELYDKTVGLAVDNYADCAKYYDAEGRSAYLGAILRERAGYRLFLAEDKEKMRAHGWKKYLFARGLASEEPREFVSGGLTSGWMRVAATITEIESRISADGSGEYEDAEMYVDPFGPDDPYLAKIDPPFEMTMRAAEARTRKARKGTKEEDELGWFNAAFDTAYRHLIESRDSLAMQNISAAMQLMRAAVLTNWSETPEKRRGRFDLAADAAIEVVVNASRKLSSGSTTGNKENLKKRGIEEYIAMRRRSYLRGYLGVGLLSMEDGSKGALGLQDDKGAVVGEVYNGTPAAAAGFKVGDVVVSINGVLTEGVDQCCALIAGFAPGTTVTVTLVRNGISLAKVVRLTARPE